MSAAVPLSVQPPGEAELLEALLASVRRAIPAGETGGAPLVRRACELGLFELGAIDPRWSEGNMELYAHALAELARHHLALARLVASEHAAPGAADASHPAAARRKAVVDALALLAGCVERSAASAAAFAADRLLFRRPLADVPAVRAALGDARATAARLRDAARALAGATGAVAGLAPWAAPANEALAAVGSMLQLHGGTGLMEESGCPDLYRAALSIVAELAARDAAPSPPRPLSTAILAAPGPGGVPLDP